MRFCYTVVKVEDRTNVVGPPLQPLTTLADILASRTASRRFASSLRSASSALKARHSAICRRLLMRAIQRRPQKRVLAVDPCGAGMDSFPQTQQIRVRGATDFAILKIPPVRFQRSSDTFLSRRNRAYLCFFLCFRRNSRNVVVDGSLSSRRRWLTSVSRPGLRSAYFRRLRQSRRRESCSRESFRLRRSLS